MDRIKDRMPPAVLDDASFSTYFQVVGQPWQGELDRALDRYMALAAKESRYWEAFQARVNDAVGTAGEAEFVHRKRGERALIDNFGMNVVGYAEAQWAQLQATGTLFPLILTASTGSTGGRTNRFQRHGSAWIMEFDCEVIRLGDSKGLRYLAYLLRHPYKEISGVELAQEIAGTAHTRKAAFDAIGSSEASLTVRIGTGDAGSRLDDQAKMEYKARLAEIDGEMSDAEELGDAEGVEVLKNEREAILAQLESATGIGGRDRVVSSDLERARTTVTNAIRRAKTQIAKVHPALADHLRYIDTGLFFSYAPPHDNVPNWEF